MHETFPDENCGRDVLVLRMPRGEGMFQEVMAERETSCNSKYMNCNEHAAGTHKNSALQCARMCIAVHCDALAMHRNA